MEKSIKKSVTEFIKSTNAADVKTALALFAEDAVIDDVSVGEKFNKTAGVRKYLEKFFVGYHTFTKLESLKIISAQHAVAQVDFTGDFGHETGVLELWTDTKGLIAKIAADLD